MILLLIQTYGILSNIQLQLIIRSADNGWRWACGSGGTAGDDRVEIQGDHRERIRPLLADKGWIVKG